MSLFILNYANANCLLTVSSYQDYFSNMGSLMFQAMVLINL